MSANVHSVNYVIGRILDSGPFLGVLGDVPERAGMDCGRSYVCENWNGSITAMNRQ